MKSARSQFLGHAVEGRRGKAVPECRTCAIAAEEAGGHDELAHDLRMPDRNEQGDRAAVAETEEIGLANVQVVQQSGGVVGRLLKAERTVSNVRSVAVTLLLEGPKPVAGELLFRP
jgi:hypothetical protein